MSKGRCELNKVFDNKTILITGGTGSFGYQFIEMILATSDPKKIIVFSRDEMKQWDMSLKFSGEERLRFFLGDVRDKSRLMRALVGVDVVIHAAALKIVPTAEYNPFECIKTNVFGAMNVVDAAIERGVERVVALSTDKASSPINLYGATKLTSDKLFVAANAYSGEHKTKFSVVRYGNVMGSRGSVIPFFLKLVKNGAKTLPITDPRMTRFMITLEEGVDLVVHALEDMIGGEIYVKKISSMNIMDIASAVGNGTKTETVGIRAGEKLHEQMIGAEDSMFTYEYPSHYKILPMINNWFSERDRIKDGRLVEKDFTYSSDVNTAWMTVADLQKWINENV